MASGARAHPCWIVLESLHKWETCFIGRMFRAWSSRPSLEEPLCEIERVWLREAMTDLLENTFCRSMRLESCCSGYYLKAGIIGDDLF